MALAPGTRLGPYEVLAPLGSGGMGEVYRAKDTKLGREVALKLLPEHLANDAERLARFEREAKTLAALNHPHIAQVHGLEDSAGARALVMELVEGPTLADRIAEGRIPLDEALLISRQIAEALEAAHDQGIIHRDLKPANIKVRSDGEVKVLDFGLAKAVDPNPTSAATDDSPTITSPAMTMRGVILGTVAYMSPEQAKGKPADRRADIWAFGCVLFEMLTARRAFEGEDVSDTLASVLKSEPQWEALPANTPARVGKLLRRCIERDVKKRLPHIGVARLELEDGARDDTTFAGVTPPTPTRAVWKTHAAWAAAAVLLAGVGSQVVRQPAQEATPARAVRFQIAPPAGHVFPGANGVPRFAISPDGSAVVFAASEIGKRDQLFIRRLGDPEARPIRGTEVPPTGGDAIQQPFFSPDGRYVAFFSGAESLLKRVPVDGGPVERLASVPTQNCGGSWHGDVILVASQGTDGVVRLPAGGGEPTPVTRLDTTRNDFAHLWPQFLPDGKRFIYLARTPTESSVFVGSLDGAPPVLLTRSDAMARFVPPDQLLYVRDTTVVRQTLDLSTLKLDGEPTVVSDAVMVAVNTRVGLATSDSGAMVVAQGPGTGGDFEIRLVDRGGRVIPPGTIESPVSEPSVRLSPDGRRIAFTKISGQTDLWVKDIERGISSRVSASDASDRLPVWSPDSTRVVYQSSRDVRGRTGLYVRDVAGLNADVLLHVNELGHQVVPEDWSPDGRFLLFRQLSNTSVDLMLLPLTGDAKPVPYLRDGFRNRQASFSPDGRWVAYGSNEGGPVQQLFVRSFPDPTAAKVQVSGDGGSQPRWRRDGRELYYIDARGRLVATAVEARDGLRFGAPVALFEAGLAPELGTSNIGTSFDVFADGQRFVVVSPRAVAAGSTLTVALNWMADLEK
jgi:eukaryotic-like serine/threonine-protein kinase